MGLFRSEEMGYYNIIMPSEAAWDVLNKLGQNPMIHFIDQDEGAPLLSRPFANFIKRCDEILVKIQFLQDEVLKFGKIIHQCECYDELIRKFNLVLKGRNRSARTYFDSIEQSIHQQYDWIQEQLRHFEHLTENKNQLLEMRAVFLKTKQVLGNAFFQSSDFEEQRGFNYYGDNIDIHGSSLMDIQGIKGGLSHITGIIDESDSNRFKRMVFRVTKGNVWTDFFHLDQAMQQGNDELIDAKSRKKPLQKVVFVIMYPGSAQETLKNKLGRVCDSFGASIYEFPQSQQQFTIKMQEIDARLMEAKQLVSMTEDQISEFLDRLTGFNDETIKMLHNLSRQSNNNMPGCDITQVYTHHLKPPTYFQTNEFTECFQIIVDTYGVPRYKEVNPGLFTIITFPFLFGVMYGDIGHGFALFTFGAYLVFRSDAIKKDSYSSLKALIPARYLIFLMGFFGFFCGFIYNDFLSAKLNLFGSCYDGEITNGQMYPKKNCTYKFGLDPAWGIAHNELSVTNSLKMKLAVILGVLQMMFGITMKAVNSIHLKQKLDLFFEFIPQILFMGATFFYMNIMIIVKWNTNYSEDTSKAPSIISMLINMPLKGGSPGENPLYDGQEELQGFLLAVALICVPSMLFPKPIIQYIQQKRRGIRYSEMFRRPSDEEAIEKHQNLLHDHDSKNSLEIELQQQNLKSALESELQESTHNEDDIIHVNHEEHSFGEIFVHQVIETIEFVLGSISNTASYLRLWALSLAHSQLAKVFFEKILKEFIQNANIFGIIIGFLLFFLFTFGVLMCMDVLECFLHALRLHWVEFQNKFYKADGYKFEPFYFVKEFKENHNQANSVVNENRLPDR